MDEEIRTEETPVDDRERIPESEVRAAEERQRFVEARRSRRDYREGRRRYRSLFWPVVLIGAGVLWLLSNFGIITSENWSVLVRLWPVLLIAAGLDLLVGRFSAVLGSLIGLATVALVVVLVIIGPSLGWAADTSFFGVPITLGDVEIQSETFVEPVGAAESAEVLLDLSFEQSTIDALAAGSDSLIEAELDYVGEVDFLVSGDRNKSVTLRQQFNQVGIFPPPGLNTRDMQWDIALSQDVPMDLTVDVGSGAAALDLRDMELTSLTLDGGSGSMEAQLPAAGAAYATDLDVSSGRVNATLANGADTTMRVNGGSGSFNFQVGSSSDLDMDADISSGSFEIFLNDDVAGELVFDGGSGSLQINVPSGAAVQVDVRDGGSGSVNLPNSFDLVDDGGDDDSDTGVWQTSGFDSAERQIRIVVEDLSSGSMTIRR